MHMASLALDCLFGLALVWDVGIIYLFVHSRSFTPWGCGCLTILVKLIPHFSKYPRDFIFFAYFHGGF